MMYVIEDTEQRLAISNQAAEEQHQLNILAKQRHDEMMVAGCAAEQKKE